MNLSRLLVTLCLFSISCVSLPPVQFERDRQMQREQEEAELQELYDTRSLNEKRNSICLMKMVSWLKEEPEYVDFVVVEDPMLAVMGSGGGWYGAFDEEAAEGSTYATIKLLNKAGAWVPHQVSCTFVVDGEGEMSLDSWEIHGKY